MEVLVWTLKQSIEKLEKENTDLKNKLSIAEAEAEEESQLACSLKEELYEYMMEHPLEACCEITGLITTEDDLQCSLEYGSLICESEWEKLPEADKKTRSELQSQLEWNMHEVTRYSVAIEEEYVLKEKYEELKKSMLPNRTGLYSYEQLK